MLELDDIQGIILQDYRHLRCARFVLASIRDAEQTRDWLASVSEHITQADTNAEHRAFNIAFTHGGFTALALEKQALDGFSVEFVDGMTQTQRQRALGDTGASAPEHWQWGGTRAAHELHLMLLFYADSQTALESLIEQITQGANTALNLYHQINTVDLGDDKEHFGFRDGIAQPVIEGYGQGPADNTIKAGEILLGHKNEYARIPLSPVIPPSQKAQRILTTSRFKPGVYDFGYNGSYLVFRQLSQDVKAFWTYLDSQSRTDNNETPAQHRDWLGAKMVGRWRNGAPVLLAPHASPCDDDPVCKEDRFSYFLDDPHGQKCPLGSHIRRANPRDSLEPEPGEDNSIQVNKRHRIIRRGRPYGPPVHESMDPQDILEAPQDSHERGLNFLCFNANIRRQFEFIQQTWINNKKFHREFNNADPLMGDHNPLCKDHTGDFTIPQTPVRRRLTGLPRFTEVVGGAYLFMPSLKALRYLYTRS